MDIKIPHSWLKDHLETSATPAKIGECLALCGPSFERLTKDGNDQVYEIEVTTNRVDAASVRGIAREAATILPQFGIAAKLKPFNPVLPKISLSDPVKLTVATDPKLNKRVMAVVIDNVSADAKAPLWMRERLERSGVRSLNLLVDITNYVMLEVGHPTHVFDYQKVKNISFRLSKKGEKIITFDNKPYVLQGSDIVIDNGSGTIIDLPGIIGTKNSVVTSETKQIIFFLDNNDPVLMRKTSLNLGIRTMAVQLNEKRIDPELASTAFARGIELYTTLAKGKIVSKIYDFYPKKQKTRLITVTLNFINSRIGIGLTSARVSEILTSLGFSVRFESKNSQFLVTVPTFRADDITIPEDIAEEVARIYGYHNLPSILMAGALPKDHDTVVFDFEMLIKQRLQGFGGIEIYTISLVSKEEAGEGALKVKNPLGDDTAYLRTTLFHTTMRSIRENSGVKEPLHLFEMANVYLPKRTDLPKEQMMLAGCLANYSYRNAKGILEALFQTLNINPSFEQMGEGVVIKAGKEILGKLGPVNPKVIYYELDVAALLKHYKPFVAYVEPSKYPAQIEDITFVFSQNTYIGEVISLIKAEDSLITNVELLDIYKDAFTFRIWYQDPKKTLTDKEVAKVREKVIQKVSKRFGAQIKD